MTDQLSLSIWLERKSRANRLLHFETILRMFPFSQREQPQTTISIHAIASTEPPLLERPINGPADPDEAIEIFPNPMAEDGAYRVESWWDLWQYGTDWTLGPVRVEISCLGPEFDNGTERYGAEQEDLRIDFGVDSHFLPRPEVLGSARLVESNIRSLLRLVHDLDLALPVEKRKLETESGENFADRLQEALSGGNVTAINSTN